MILVFWIGGVDAAAVEAGLAGCEVDARVYTAVVDDGILDVHVEASSAPEARRVERAVVDWCRSRTGATLDGAWAFGSATPALAHV